MKCVYSNVISKDQPWYTLIIIKWESPRLTSKYCLYILNFFKTLTQSASIKKPVSLRKLVHGTSLQFYNPANSENSACPDFCRGSYRRKSNSRYFTNGQSSSSASNSSLSTASRICSKYFSLISSQ